MCPTSSGAIVDVVSIEERRLGDGRTGVRVLPDGGPWRLPVEHNL